MLGFFATAFGIYLVQQTLRANREAVAKAAESNSISREIGEAQVRAYLNPADPAIAFTDANAGFDDLTPIFKCKIKNTGNSPAFMTNVICSMRFEDGRPAWELSEESAHQFVDTISSNDVTRDILFELHRSIADHPSASTSKAILIVLTLRVDWINVFSQDEGFDCSYLVEVANPFDKGRRVNIYPAGYNLRKPQAQTQQS